jgi:MspA
VNSVPNPAAAVNSREGFVTVKGTATASGGPHLSWTACSSLATSPDVNQTSPADCSAARTPVSHQVFRWAAAVSTLAFRRESAASCRPSCSPGSSSTYPLSNMALDKDGHAVLDVDNIHIKADACGGDVTIRVPAGVNGFESHVVRHLRGSGEDMKTSTSFAIVLALAVRISAPGSRPAHADPVGPPPVPPSGAAFGPPGWTPPPRFGAPRVFANTHGPTDSRAVKVTSNADPAEAGTGLPESVLGNSPAPNQNFGPNHGVSAFAGFEAAPPQSSGAGTQVGAAAPTLEDPHGRPLQDAPPPPRAPTVKSPAATE